MIALAKKRIALDTLPASAAARRDDIDDDLHDGRRFRPYLAPAGCF